MSVGALKRVGRPEPPEWKVKLVEELAEELKKYPVIGIADLTGMPTAQLQLIRKKFRKRVQFKVVKKRLFFKALERAGIDKEKFEPYVKGTILLMLTDMNPFKLARAIESEKMPAPAKPGMVAEKEIVIPEGDTGLQPGPILSTFGKLRIPYEIRRGTIYVKKDTVVAKPGDVISEDLAGLLQTLGIMPFEVGLKIQAVYDRGTIIPREELLVDLEKFKEDLLMAAREAIAIAAEAAIPLVPEAVSMMLTKAVAEALAVLRTTGILMPGTVEEVIRSAVAEALSVAIALGDKAKELGIEVVSTTRPAAEAQQPKETEKEEKEEEKEEEEVDIGEGLAGLFG